MTKTIEDQNELWKSTEKKKSQKNKEDGSVDQQDCEAGGQVTRKLSFEDAQEDGLGCRQEE